MYAVCKRSNICRSGGLQKDTLFRWNVKIKIDFSRFIINARSEEIEHALRACGMGAGDQWDCFAATTLAAHPAGRRCASGQSPLPLCCAKCPERDRRALSPFGAALPPRPQLRWGYPPRAGLGGEGAWEPTGLPRPRHRNGLKPFLMPWG